jgi:hypothetical protein
VGDINQMRHIPFSIHEKSGKECFIVGGQLERDKVRSVEYSSSMDVNKKTFLYQWIRQGNLVKRSMKKESNMLEETLPLRTRMELNPVLLKS